MQRTWVLVPYLLMQAAAAAEPAYFVESFNAPAIDTARWNVPGDAQTHLELVEVSPGDRALALRGEVSARPIHVYTRKAISRTEGLSCEFKIWLDAGAANTSIYGPWHHTHLPGGMGSQKNSTLDAGVRIVGAPDGTRSVQWAEAGDATMGWPGPRLDEDFTHALRTATSKEQAALIRIELGKITGARGTYSTDGGRTWRPLRTADGQEIDTRGKGAVENWQGVKVSSHRFDLVGFVIEGGTVFIDDVTIRPRDVSVTTIEPPGNISNARDLVAADMLLPDGEWTEREMPDTLDLAERGELLVKGITNFVNPKQGCAPFGQGYFNVNPPYMTQINGSEGHACWPKSLEAMAKARAMSGSRENLDVHRVMFENMLLKAAVMNPNAHDPWLPREMLAVSFAYQVHPTPELKELLDQWTEYQVQVVREGDGMAFFDASEGAMEDTMLGVMGNWRAVFIQGTMVRTLSHWHRVGGNQPSLELSGKLVPFLLQPKYWQAEADPKVVVGAERGHFMGHHHSHTTALLGLLWYAAETNDTRLMEFVRGGYEYMRNFGLPRIGLFAEMCTTGDMTQLALRLSELGVGDYWDDADCYIRNQLTENQITDVERLRAAVKQMPKNDRLIDPYFETDENVIERNLGVYLSDASNPTLVREKTLIWTICCNGNCGPALYYAWDATVRFHDGTAQVNFLLNRVSPWLDVDSYLPYEGKVVLHNKRAERIYVRMPRWVPRDQVSAVIDGREVEIRWLDRNMLLDPVEPGMTVTIAFPMVRTEEIYTLKWRETDFWYESTNPGWNWKPDEKPARFTLTMKGNTMVDITPRSQARGYPLYLRDHLRDGNQTPMRTVRRFIPHHWPPPY